MRRYLAGVVGLLLSYAAFGQDTGLGARPPVRSADALPSAAATSAAASAQHDGTTASLPMARTWKTQVQGRLAKGVAANGVAVASPAQGGQVSAAATEPGAAGAVVAPARPHVNRPKGFVPPPPATMTLTSGVNATVAIAYGHVNRIVTPFHHPQVKTNSTAGISVEGSIVYVSASTDEPIGMFIHDAAHGERAVSVTLIPEDVPPVSTEIKLAGADPAGDIEPFAPATAVAEDTALREDTAMNGAADTRESDDTYVGHLVQVMKDLARERVPAGYSLEPVQGYLRIVPSCSMPGLRLVPKQAIVGHDFVVLVEVATNVVTAPAAINEEACGERARAVAAWPKRILAPGESSEIYVVVSRKDAEDRPNVRPSALGGV